MDFVKLPIGFAMALVQNESAMAAFHSMDQAQRGTVLTQARAARSEAEMNRIVANLSAN